MTAYAVRDNCRLCSHEGLETVLELEPTPPANEFVPASQKDEEQEKFPLYLAQCKDCGHVQLPVVVDPERLFGNYVYVSGTSPAFVKHFQDYAAAMIDRHGLKPGDLVVDIGSNDGTLLHFFKQAGMRVLGIDPATRIAKQATGAGVETWPVFFTHSVAETILTQHGPAKLVVANNVFAHADDLMGMAEAVKHLLEPSTGRFVFEVSYLLSVIKKTLFDTIYHEHLSYHSAGPLIRFFWSLGMAMIDAELIDTHGGSIRCTVAPSPNGFSRVSDRLTEILAIEEREPKGSPFEGLKTRIDEVRGELLWFLEKSRKNGKTVAGFGAPAKATTLTHQFEIDGRDIAYVVDDSHWKQGLLMPGSHIPVVSPEELTKRPPDHLVVFAWNFADQIIAKNQAFKLGGGSFVVPLPEFREV